MDNNEFEKNDQDESLNQGENQSQGTVNQDIQSQNAGTQGSENQANQQAESPSEPQPMPSQDNIYRYQNVNATSDRERSTSDNNNRDNNNKVPIWAKVVLSVVALIVVGCMCFLGGLAIGDTVNQSQDAISSVNGGNSNGSGSGDQIKAVTGAAIAGAGTNDVSGIVERVMPSVVAVNETSIKKTFFGEYPSTGAGSGFIVKQDKDELLVVTNNHVVEGADKISVKFCDDTSAEAKIKGTDANYDLAVITVKLKGLKDSTKKAIRVASLGHSDDVKVGQMAIVIGNALGYGQSVTVGYISAKDREVKMQKDESSNDVVTRKLLQTDAAINPGNSGGALIDANGNVIGIPSVKLVTTSVEGVGYAIPMSQAIPIINDLMDRQVLDEDEKGYLGITGKNITDDISQAYKIPKGVYVYEVSKNGAAEKAGIKSGDVITKINDYEVSTIDQVQKKVNSIKAGTKVTVVVMRSDNGEYKEKKIDVVLGDASDIKSLGGTENKQNPGNSQGYGSDGSGSSDGFGGFFGGGQEDDSYGSPYGDSDGSTQIIPW
ncbi:S1C family serine protease [Eubacterium xylanophilum]|uniref:S1C family serine protease n=1 Tax=Eubacterium xylanophilum TaxID=39497 RepID=UPI0004B0EAEC|nr:trypsin-like peptidase domain-containing protein [Eubacterium xylanophilum]